MAALLRKGTSGAARAVARAARVRGNAGVSAAWLSSGGAKEWPGVTNSASRFDPRKFLQSEGPHPDAEVASLRRALLYRSRQTGWLETDLIMGRWAAENLDKLSVAELQEYARIVQCEILDIFQWINGQQEVPAEIDGKIMKQLQEYSVNNPPAPPPGSHKHTARK